MEGMKTMTQVEVERLMKKASRRRAILIRELMEKVAALEVGQEHYQHFLSALPKTDELRQLANRLSPDMDFNVFETINGYRFIRTR
jgi:hypothetical protein